EYGIYEAELIAQILGLRLLQGERGVQTVSIAVDSRSTLEAFDRTTTGTGEYLLEVVREECASAVRKAHHRLDIELRWVPGHEGVAGNERVDGEAKKAAEGTQVHRWVAKRVGEPMPVSKSAVRADNRERMKEWLR
ncbi:hypothetical protein FA15DRAFT_574554, partial [Coprinopsis marcescibilis]